MNNTDRSQWIDNDEGLYNWWKSSKLSKAKFIKENKCEIDSLIHIALLPKNQHRPDLGRPTY